MIYHNMWIGLRILLDGNTMGKQQWKKDGGTMEKGQWKKYAACCVMLLGTLIFSGCSAVKETAGRLQKETGIALSQSRESGQTGPGSIDVLADEKEINDKEALVDYVQEGLGAGMTEIVFTTSQLTQKDIKDLNTYIEGFYGSVDQFQITGFKFLHRSEVTLSCTVSDNYYIEQKLMKGLDIPKDREKAEKTADKCRKILKQIKGKSDYEKEKWIHDYLVKNIVYGYPDDDQAADGDAFTTYGALIRGKCVCNGYAEAMKLLCDLSGIDCKMITGTAGGENHAWNLVKLGEEWYHTDVTWDDPSPDVKGRVLYTYFNVEETAIDKSHSWDDEWYRTAAGKEYNYFRQTGKYCKKYRDFRNRCEDELEETGSPKNLQYLVKDYDQDTYNEESLQFIMKYSGAKSLNFSVSGQDDFKVLYFSLKY